MKFPKSLYLKNRQTFPEHKIHVKNRMYARHKLGYDWKNGDEFPIYSKIKVDQSFNWSAYSIPYWTRFNDRKDYLLNYGIMSYSVNTIRNIHAIQTELNERTLGLKHDPTPNNYSHCVIYPDNVELTKITKRYIRYALTHSWEKKIEPNKKFTRLYVILEHLIMFKHRILVKFSTES